MWRKSSYCRTDTPMCVEVQNITASTGTIVGVEVRNSRLPNTYLAFTPEEWARFIQGAKAGEFDLK